MKRHLLNRFISFMLILCVISAFGAVTVYAEPAQDQGQNQQQDQGQEQQEAVPETPQNQPEAQEQQETPQDQQQETPQEQPETPQQSQEQANEWYDYIYSYDEDAVSSYVEPEHLGELPEVSSQQVVEATAVPMPTVAVSDASMLSGIVMWLCVVLGIAVVVGVLVSKRTRRRGA